MSSSARTRGTRLGRTIVAAAVLVGGSGLWVVSSVPEAGAVFTERASVSSTGAQANNVSDMGGMSPDGRFVGFSSHATNLVAGDSNGVGDAFVRDRRTGTTDRVSRSSTGVQSNGYSFGAWPSADGQEALFLSFGSNLVPGDTNGADDLFVKDRQTGALERVNLSSSGAQAASPTGVYGNTPCLGGPISDDGRYVAFHSLAANLVPGDTNGQADVFVRDRQTGSTERVSVDSAGNQGNGYSDYYCAMSSDGRFVAFSSTSSDLVPGDTNGQRDAFVHDRATGVTERVSVTSGEQESATGCDGSDPLCTVVGGVSGDGRFVAFMSKLSTLAPGDTDGAANLFVRDRTAGTTTRVPKMLYGERSVMSADGNSVAFSSHDTNGDPQLYVYRRASGAIELASANTSGQPGHGSTGNFGASLSADGSIVAFRSRATDLVPGDTNNGGDEDGGDDIFVHDFRTPLPPQVTIASPTQGQALQVGDTVAADYSCTDVTGFGLASCTGTVPDGQPVDSSSAGVKTFTVTGTEAVRGQHTTRSVTYTVFDKIVSETFGAGGGVVTTDPGGAGPTPAEPVAAAVASPNAGSVVVALGVNTTPTPSGFSLLTKQVTITAPPASSAAPLTLVFDLDSSLVPSGETKDSVSVLKDGALLPDCLGETELPTGVHACVTGRDDGPTGGGSVRLTVISDSASRWNVAAGSPTPPVVSTGSRSSIEANVGTHVLSFPVVLSQVAAVPVSVHWATANLTAVAPGDYVSGSGDLTFVPGQAAKTVSVTIKGDTLQEADEAFRVVLSNPANATIGVGTAAGTIVDDDTLTIRTTSLPAGRIGTPYGAGVAVTGGTAPYKWTRIGSLPKGLKLQARTGVISGTPKKVRGTFTFTVQVKDKAKPAHVVGRTMSITIT